MCKLESRDRFDKSILRRILKASFQRSRALQSEIEMLGSFFHLKIKEHELPFLRQVPLNRHFQQLRQTQVISRCLLSIRKSKQESMYDFSDSWFNCLESNSTKWLVLKTLFRVTQFFWESSGNNTHSHDRKAVSWSRLISVAICFWMRMWNRGREWASTWLTRSQQVLYRR
jgi:hypothetical protein